MGAAATGPAAHHRRGFVYIGPGARGALPPPLERTALSAAPQAMEMDREEIRIFYPPASSIDPGPPADRN